MSAEHSISQALTEIRLCIERAAVESGRAAEAITLLGVSKTKPVAMIEAAVAAGLSAFGENYVQEAVQKVEQCATMSTPNGTPVRFDFIGALQSNKAKDVVGRFALIHTVDRSSLVRELGKRARRAKVTQRVLLQVNTSGEASKSGVDPDEAVALANTVISEDGLVLDGCMCIGRYVPVDCPEEERAADFRALVATRDKLQQSLGRPLPELSMGMSHDFELAIRYGATIVRVGSAIFGERQKK